VEQVAAPVVGEPTPPVVAAPTTAPRMAVPWFGVRRPLDGRRSLWLWLASFLLPLAVWGAVSYVPWLWHPLVRVTAVGSSGFLAVGMEVPCADFAAELAALAAAGKPLAEGMRVNPVFLPAPHEVALALVTAFTTPPRSSKDPWLHESLLSSIATIAIGFAIAVAVGVPLGILCGTFTPIARLTEPFVDFVRYMPAPAFAALAVAVFGIYGAPKVAIIVIGLVFNLILVVANTTRQVDHALLEAAQTLGATSRRLVTRVVLPGMLPNLYNDLRIVLGTAWTMLIIAELIGATSGISYFINQQGKYRHYDQVFAGIIIIGVIGLVTDQALAWLGRRLFPWQAR
jgi:NitT/TauT family transport system permease protein